MNIVKDNFIVDNNNENLNKETGNIENIENKKDNVNIIIEKKDSKVKQLLSKINNIKLNNEQYIEIYKIIKMDNNIKIMTNKNGVFVDLQYLDKPILNKLEIFIHYITTNELSKNIV